MFVTVYVMVLGLVLIQRNDFFFIFTLSPVCNRVRSIKYYATPNPHPNFTNILCKMADINSGVGFDTRENNENN